MTAQYDAAECKRLAAEAREDDARMTRAPWTTPTGNRFCGAVSAVVDGVERQVAAAAGQAPQFDDVSDVAAALGANAAGIARARNNLRAMADQLEAAGRAIAELEKRPLRTFDQVAADRLADEVAVLVARKVIDSRSPAADALLDYREPPRSERSDRMVSLERQLASMRERIAELELDNGALTALHADLGAQLTSVRAERDTLQQQLDSERKVHDYYRSLLAQSNADHNALIVMKAQLTAILRAIYPVYRAAAELRDGPPIHSQRQLANAIDDALGPARAALTPDLVAALQAAGLEDL